MNKRKYPTTLFIFVFISNVIFRYFFLFIPSLILIIVGIFNRYCLIIGIGILVIDLSISLINQLIIRNSFFSENDSLDFQEYQEAITKEGSWIDNVINLINENINKYLDENEEEYACEDEEDYKDE